MADTVSQAVDGVQEAVAERIEEAREDALENAAAQIAVAEETGAGGARRVIDDGIRPSR
jgi:hypothetical protein